ncbi:MAG: Glutathione import ATP-binding protein GsiA [Serratia liquefaciens]
MTAVTDKKVLLEVADLKVHFDIHDDKQWFWQPPKTLKAVDGVTLRLFEGETLGVVGESRLWQIDVRPRHYRPGEGYQRPRGLVG